MENEEEDVEEEEEENVKWRLEGMDEWMLGVVLGFGGIV
jgi:hypothetical protein